MASQRENLGEVGGDRFETSKGCRLVDLKNIHSLKSESYVFFWWEFLGLQAQETESQVTLRELLEGGEEPGYIEVL